MSRLNEGGKTRHPVLHDYGTGGLWWWVRAGSAEEIEIGRDEFEDAWRRARREPAV
ncbi:hypothetical protein [Kitasatospora griseola]|uniref:hypothetical protein n=1 Tax=Kitasatospora griseola TaxID=2064 RepID=UPI0037F46C24